jgi:hypothetical protein
LTAANLLELAACDGVQIRFAPSGNLKASGPSDAPAIWLPELKALKPAIAAVAARVNNAAHRCDAYGQLAPISVSARICAGSGRAMVLRGASSASGGASVTSETASSRSSSPAALRMRRHRERRRDGLRCKSAKLRAAQTGRNESGGRAVEPDAKEVSGLREPCRAHRLRINVEIIC